jgi:predicted ATPase/DNA-binding SARP family transcriptional activator
MMNTLWRIQLLGVLRAQYGDHELSRFPGQRAAFLFGYLACHHSPAPSRDTLIDLFWPDLDVDSARNNLRGVLHALRRRLSAAGEGADHLLVADRGVIGFRPGAFTTDLQELQAELQAARAAPPQERRAHLMRAADLCGGELLPGCYEAWALAERVRVQDLQVDALHQLVAVLESEGEQKEAIEVARRAVGLDPLREESHCELMRLYAATGQAAALRRQYQELEQALREGLEESPSAATRALLEELRNNARTVIVTRRVPPAQPPALPDAAPATAQPNGSGFQSGEQAPPRLPAQLTRFFGREQEILRIAEMLCLPDQRLVTLTGPGGSGKTRLAIAVAGRLGEAFNGAVWLVPLADLADPSQIPGALSDALGLPPSPKQSREDPVIAALRGQRALLVLDNFEHMVEGSGEAKSGALQLRAMLERLPGLTCLVTSRRRLNLEGEQEFAILPLPTPRRSDPLERLQEYASVQLFVDRARSVRPEFCLTEENRAAVVALCDRLEGLPLALELAAARVQMLTPEQILAHLEEQLEFLVSRQQDVPARHRSLRVAIDSSFQLLPPALRHFLVRLSVFRGGWTLEAAGAICADAHARRQTPATRGEESLSSLASGVWRLASHDVLDLLTQLAERSLLVVETAGSETRYRMLEPVRRYARDRLAEIEDTASWERRHRDWYLALVEQAAPQLRGPAQGTWLKRLDVELENLFAALAFCHADPAGAEAGLRLAGGLGRFWEMRSRTQEGCYWLEVALDRGKSVALSVRATALTWLGRLVWWQGDNERANALLEESLALWREVDEPWGLAFALLSHGLVARSRRDLAAAQRLHEQSLALFREIGDRWGVAWSLHDLGITLHHRGDRAEARSYFQEGVAIARELGDLSAIAQLLIDAFATAAWNQGDVATASALSEESLAIFRELEDQRGIAQALNGAANLARIRGDTALARALLEEELAIREALSRETALVASLGWTYLALGNVTAAQGEATAAYSYYRRCLDCFTAETDALSTAFAFERVAVLAATQGQPARAVRLFGAAAKIREGAGFPVPSIDRAEYYDRSVADLQSALGETAFQEAWSEGARMALGRVVAEAEEVLTGP